MSVGLALPVVGLVIFLLNVPFGYWRANTRRFSLRWALSIHIPVPFVVLLRLWAGIGWRLAYVFPMIVCFFAGQYAGGWVRKRLAARRPALSSCLVVDILRSKGEPQGAG